MDGGKGQRDGIRELMDLPEGGKQHNREGDKTKLPPWVPSFTWVMIPKGGRVEAEERGCQGEVSWDQAREPQRTLMSSCTGPRVRRDWPDMSQEDAPDYLLLPTRRG